MDEVANQIATLSFVGPGKTEERRLRNLLTGIAVHEPAVSRMIVVDDSSETNIVSCAPEGVRSHLHVVENPRHGGGDWWKGGLCCGLIAGLRFASDNNETNVVRLDTDSLVIKPFADHVCDEFAANADVGLLGVWNRCPRTGHQRLPHPDTCDVMKTICDKLTRSFAVWRHSDWPTRLQSSFRRADRVIRTIVRDAVKNGYRPGDFVQGGGYAISAKMVKRLEHRGYLRSPLNYLHLMFSEDHLATILCYAVGLTPTDSSIFGTMSRGLPGKLTEIDRSDFAIIHSVKNDKIHSEDEIIEHFLHQRESEAAGSQ